MSWLERLMGQGKVVLATGVFDLLHIGHVRFLIESKRRGGPRAKLVVVIARDTTVFKRKGHKPIVPEAERREIIGSLKAVDRAILGHVEFDMLGVLDELKPDIVAVGYDQRDIKLSLEKLVRREKLRVSIIQIPMFGSGATASSSRLKSRIVKAWSLGT